MESDDEVESGYVTGLVIDPQPISLKNDLIGKKIWIALQYLAEERNLLTYLSLNIN